MAFAKAYWSEGGEALKTGDTSRLKKFAAKDCDVCHTYIESVDDNTKKGLHANVNPSKIGSAKVTDKTEGQSDQVVTLDVADSKYLLVDEDGKAVAQADPVDYDIQIYVDWKSSRWIVVDSFMFTK